MKRSHWIILLALAAVNMVVMGAGLTALGTAILVPAERLPTVMAPVAFVPVAAITAVPSATARPTVPRPTNTPAASATPEPTPLGGAQAAASPTVTESSPMAEPSATPLSAVREAPRSDGGAQAAETLVPPTPQSGAPAADSPVPTEPPPPDTPTLEVAWEPSPLPPETATPAPVAPVPPSPTTPPTNTPAPTATAVPPPTVPVALALNAPASYIFPATAHASQIFLQGKNLGNRANVFALVGDSNTDNPNFFAPFDTGNYTLGPYAYLQDTINYFRGSFGQHSPAAVGSFSTARALDPAYADPARCLPGETPLACEYRLQRPSVVLILIGTGDHLDWANFEGRYRRILDFTLAQGIVPVLMTIADDLDSQEQGAPYQFTNNVIRRVSADYDVPLLDLRRVVDLLPNHGCGPDGFHYNTPPDGRSADFTGDHLLYGYPVRNLTALFALDELRRSVLQP